MASNKRASLKALSTTSFVTKTPRSLHPFEEKIKNYLLINSCAYIRFLDFLYFCTAIAEQNPPPFVAPLQRFFDDVAHHKEALEYADGAYAITPMIFLGFQFPRGLLTGTMTPLKWAGTAPFEGSTRVIRMYSRRLTWVESRTVSRSQRVGQATHVPTSTVEIALKSAQSPQIGAPKP